MMALNRYRLRHLSKNGHYGAILASRLLQRPDRLLGLILISNNVANVFATSIATVIAVKLVGPYGYVVAPIILIPVILVFSETAPKTYAAIRPENIAFPVSRILLPLLKIGYPLIYVVNKASNALLIPFGIKKIEQEDTALSQDELRTVVREAGSAISSNHKKMLLSILDMENVVVDDIMVPRNELLGINLNDSAGDIIEQLLHSRHTRLLVYQNSIDDVLGILHVRQALWILNNKNKFDTTELKRLVREPYYLPEGTPLHTQMLNFQKQKQRVGLVVDEYGVIQGMVTLDDILEEIIGEFTTDMQTFKQNIQQQPDGSYFIDGTTTLRDINKQLDWHLPHNGTKTINGLILKNLENIPESGTSLRIENYALEITQMVDNAVKKVKIIQLVDDQEAPKNEKQ